MHLANPGFERLLIRTSQLRVLSMKFCPHVTQHTLTIIANEANPFFLRELYLDGCDKLRSFEELIRPRKHLVSRHLQSALENDQVIAEFRSKTVRNLEFSEISNVALGGAMGLEVISFAECKNINDYGIMHLKGLKYLTKVVMLGCQTI